MKENNKVSASDWMKLKKLNDVIFDSFIITYSKAEMLIGSVPELVM